MLSLTVGQVSGIIQALITALQLFFPTALALLIVGVLRDDMSAVSWSSIGATLHSSYWASILRADTAVSTNVQRSVRWLLRLASVTMLLIAVASIITPLGLSDTIEPNDTLQDVSFPYLADSGPFGYGTPPRDELGFNRQCGIPTFAACPGSNTVEIKPEDDTISSDFPFGYDSRIPQEKIDLFQSGLKEQMQTVSSFFDIQYRSVSKQQDPDVNNGSLYHVGTFRQVGSLILDDAVEAIEGLIVDTKGKGIAFRNHTLPSGIPLGATWEEDLLVMEPVTQCVDTNLTIDFISSGLNGTFGGDAKSPVLTDRGGFVNIAKDFPDFDISSPQIDPDLYGRAYLGAWAFNVYTAIYLNVTRPKPDRFGYLESEIGKRFFMPESTLLHVDEVTIGSYGDLFGRIEYDNSSFTSGDQSDSPAPWPNPFQVSSSNFSDITDACAGSNLANSNMSATAVGCGVVYGAPRLENGKTALFYDPGTKLSMPIYSCATAVKASIKTFSLRYNGTEGLKSLRVDAIKEYTGEPTQWGIENNNDRKDLDIDSAPPIWGLVSSDTQPSKNLDVITSPHLYLPGTISTFTGLSSIGSDNMPGLDFPSDALSTIYAGDLGESVGGTGDYSGRTSFAMFAKWQQLMSSANGTARIIDLIYTDLSANGLVGTKSWLHSSNVIPGGEQDPNAKLKRQSTSTGAASSSGALPTARVPVRLYERRIQYNYLFGIPAYISLLVSVLIGTLTLLYVLSGRTSLSKTKRCLKATSPGRIMSLFVYPGESEPQQSSKRWVRSTGAKKIKLSETTGWRPVAVERIQHPEKLNGFGGGHGPAVYTGETGMHNSTTHLPGYENDLDPLIETKPGMVGSAIQMTPMHSPNPNPMPVHGGFQQQGHAQGYYAAGHVAAQQQQQQQGGYPMGGFAR